MSGHFTIEDVDLAAVRCAIVRLAAAPGSMFGLQWYIRHVSPKRKGAMTLLLKPAGTPLVGAAVSPHPWMLVRGWALGLQGTTGTTAVGASALAAVGAPAWVIADVSGDGPDAEYAFGDDADHAGDEEDRAMLLLDEDAFGDFMAIYTALNTAGDQGPMGCSGRQPVCGSGSTAPVAVAKALPSSAGKRQARAGGGTGSSSAAGPSAWQSGGDGGGGGGGGGDRPPRMVLLPNGHYALDVTGEEEDADCALPQDGGGHTSIASALG